MSKKTMTRVQKDFKRFIENQPFGNKFSPNSNDLCFWYDFIITSRRYPQSKIKTYEIRTRLIEEGFDASSADQYICIYEHGIDLLKKFKEPGPRRHPISGDIDDHELQYRFNRPTS